MHILYVTTEFVTDENFYGGLANFTANIATIFADRNNKITQLSHQQSWRECLIYQAN